MSPVRLAAGPAIFGDLVKQAFSLRRKTLGNALKGRVDATLFRMAGIDPQRRGETLSIDEFILLANQLAKHAGDS